MRTKQEQNINRRILYLWLPNIALDRLKRMTRRRGDENSSSNGMVIVRTEYGRRTIVATCPVSEKLGIVVGWSLGNALALHSKLLVGEIDPMKDKMELTTLANWCGRYTPFVAFDESRIEIGERGLWLDITGCSHLFGGEEKLLDDIIDRLCHIGLTARGVIADTPGAAWALAHFGKLSSQIIKPGSQQAAIADLPLIGLRLPTSLVEDLSKVGLRQIKSLFSIARAPLRARFGAEVRKRLDQALGLEAEPISPQISHSPDLVRFVLPDPISTMDSILAVLECLLERLIKKLEIKSLGTRELKVLLYRVDGQLDKLIVSTSQINRDKSIFSKLFFEKFNNFVLDSGVDVITLEATKVDIYQPLQPDLISQSDRINSEISVLVDRLVNRFGSSSVIRRSLQESYSPERSETTFPVSSNLHYSKITQSIGSSFKNTLTVRPLYLLQRPEYIEPLTECNRPLPFQFRWRHTLVNVRRANGPERIAPEWWLVEDYYKTRDYFRIEDSDGRRYWLFKERMKQSKKKPSWYLHGLFS
ncbi:MAG: Y-family DNA polymerase [Thalassobaculaceae bacterium]